MKKLLTILLFLSTVQAMAQQDALYSQYMYNPFVVNPAYAGTRNSYSAVLLHRSQWINIDGAPQTQSVAVHAPTNKYNLAWGVNFGHDGLGPQNSYTGAGTIGYHLKFKNSKLAFALRGGFISTVFDYNKLNFKDDGDVFDLNGKYAKTVPSFDFGTYYYGKKFYIGFSVNHITKHKIAFQEADLSGTSLSAKSGLYLRRHFFLTGGYVFDIRPNFVIKPSFLLKHTNGAPPNLDLNFSMLFYKRVWLGFSARSTSTIVAMLDVNITDFLRLGYAYDLSINKLGSYNKGSHEVFIGFDFNLKKSDVVSPRYL